MCDGSLVGGAITVDMESISVTDIPIHEPVPREWLTTHLRSDDFFATEACPTARLEISPPSQRSPTPLASRGRSRSAAWSLRPRSTLAWRSFPPTSVRAEARFDIDRQLWGIDFTGSELTNDLVDDVIFLDIRLVANR